jgi:hypothetical protein
MINGNCKIKHVNSSRFRFTFTTLQLQTPDNRRKSDAIYESDTRLMLVLRFQQSSARVMACRHKYTFSGRAQSSAEFVYLNAAD